MWQYLPDIILEQVYSLLSQRQRYACSLVCRHWNEVLHSPQLWKHIVFKDLSFTRRRYYPFTGYRDEIYHKRLQLYLAHVGHHCHTMTFEPVLNFYNLHEYLRVVACFVEFFDEYSFPLLHTFRFTFACESREFKEVTVNGTGGQLLDETKRVLRDLRDLRHITLNHLFLDTTDAASLLDDVVNNFQSTLQHLELLNATKVPYPIYSIAQLTSLRSLTLTRVQLTPTFLIYISRDLPLLERLTLVEERYRLTTSDPDPSTDPLVVDRQTWLEAANIAPHMRIRLEYRRDADDDTLADEDFPDGAAVDSVIYSSPRSRVTFRQVAQLCELYQKTLRVFGHVGRGRSYRPRPFNERADEPLVYLIRNCCSVTSLAIHERVSTATLLVLASERRERVGESVDQLPVETGGEGLGAKPWGGVTRALRELFVRRNAVILRCDWPRHPDWPDEKWAWLKENSKSYEKTENEIARCLGCERWQMLSDRSFRKLKL